MNSEDLDEMLSSFEDLKISMSRKHALGKDDTLTPLIVFTFQSFKNRKERRKALREKIEEKRKKSEKTEKKEKKKMKKHHRHKKRKKRKESNGASDNDNYVEDKMRKRKKKKRKHKREKDKKKESEEEVIDLREEDEMQFQNEQFEKEYILDDESVLVIDETVKSPETVKSLESVKSLETDKSAKGPVCDSHSIEKEKDIDHEVQSINICDENLTASTALGKATQDKSPEQDTGIMDFEDSGQECVADKTNVHCEILDVIPESENVTDAIKLVRDDTKLCSHSDTEYMEENTNTKISETVNETNDTLRSSEENVAQGIETMVSNPVNVTEAETSKVIATESKEELDLKYYDVAEESVGASGSADNSIVISSESESELESGELSESESSASRTGSDSSVLSDSSPDSDSVDSDSVELIEEEIDWRQKSGKISNLGPVVQNFVSLTLLLRQLVK